jgi:hypothetical protein
LPWHRKSAEACGKRRPRRRPHPARNVRIVRPLARTRLSALIAARRTGIPSSPPHGIYTAKEPFKHFYNSIMVKSDVTIANSEWTAAHIARPTARV